MANFKLHLTATENTYNSKAKTNTNTLMKLKKPTVYTMNHRYRRRLWRRGALTILHTSSHSHWSWPLLVLMGILFILQNLSVANAELVRELDISEGVPVGHQIGYIGEQLPGVDSGPPYLIVPVPGSGVDTDLAIDHTTGEIRTKVRLDRETRASYSLVAIPLSGENVRVLIRVHDENDNAPTFPTAVMNIEFPENTPRDVKRTLHPARDLDLGRYNTQRYNIVSGNTNNAFRLSSHRERDGVLYLDLQINGFLDRETTPFYSLVIEALDGGSPPLRGQMTVNITIQDVNDNQPIFNQSRYFATVAENATVGTMVLQVYATDVDADENGLVEYSINRRQSDREQMFRIDAQTGWIFVNKPLDFETKELHELVVVAKDHGETPLETTAFVSIKVTDVNDNQPTINVIFLSDDATPKISESAEPGEFVARISVHDPDSKTEYANVNVTLNGGDGHFGLTTRDNIIYLVIVNMTLDRELTPNYTLSVVATDNGNPPLHASKTIHLRVTDINDNAPEFERTVYQANVMEISDPGTSVIQVYAYDRDEGNNSAVTYSLLETPDSHSQWFTIDEYTGLISTKTHIDCETEPVPQLTVVAHDNGHPPLSSTATVLVTIHDVNDNEPIFEQTYYNITVAENETKGRCILKITNNQMDNTVVKTIAFTDEMKLAKINNFSWPNLLPELLIYSSNYLSRSDLQQLRLVCKLWNQVTYLSFIKKSKLIINRYNVATLREILHKDDKFSGSLAYDSVEIHGIDTSDVLQPVLKLLGPKIHKICLYRSQIFKFVNDCLPQLEELRIRHIAAPQSDNLISFNLRTFKNLKSLDIKCNSVYPYIEKDIMWYLTQEENLKIEKLCIEILPKHQERLIHVLQSQSESLKHLEIKFHGNNLYILKWAQTFAMLKHLRVLKFSGSHSKQCLSSIMNSLSKKIPLQHFCLDSVTFVNINWSASLTSIELIDCHRVSNEDIKNLITLRHTLRHLVIKNSSIITVAGLLQGIASETNNVLRTLVYEDPRSCYNNILHMPLLVQRLPHLNKLSLKHNKESVDNVVLSNIFRHQIYLQHLNLDGCSQITDAGLLGFGSNRAPITNLKRLQSLSLCHCQKITDKFLTKGLKLIELRTLNCCHCPYISSKGIKEIIKNCSALEEISLLDCNAINDDLILDIAKGLPRLRKLNIDFCERLTIKCIDYIKEFCKSLKELSMQGQPDLDNKENFEKLAHNGIRRIRTHCPPPPHLEIVNRREKAIKTSIKNYKKFIRNSRRISRY